MSNKDQFGYYTVKQHKTYSKIEALELAHNLNVPVKWNFNETIFSQYPWHIDTKENIKILYKRRAEQIRQKYDYLVVWYSGGADSFTVLNTFKENNIHVDEIAQFHSYEGEKTWNSYLNKEIETVAIPGTKEFLNSMPHTKHRLVDLTPIIKSVFGEDRNKFDFIYKSNHSFGPHQLARTYVRDKIDDWRKIIESGKKLCFIWGVDKPPVRYDSDNDKYYLEFFDIVDGGGVGPRIQQENRSDWHDEFFYWSPDSMDIIARQGHIIVNYLRNIPKEDLDTQYLTRDRYSYSMSYNGDYIPQYLGRPGRIVNGIMYHLTSEGSHRLVYPDWKETTFSLGKPFSYTFSPRDRWWYEALRAQDQRMHRTAIESFYKKFTKFGFNNYRNLRQRVNLDFRNISIDLCFTKKYFLEK